MCTVVLYVGQWARFPVVMAANRDEYPGREWLEPAAHWPDVPALLGPRDVASGGTWFAVHRRGLVAAVLNQGRAQSLQRPGHASRGELVLHALRADSLDGAVARVVRAAGGVAEAEPAAEAGPDGDTGRYLPFHLVVADRREARVVSCANGRVQVCAIGAGVHLVSSRGVDAPGCERAARFLPALRRDVPKIPEQDDWRALRELLATRAREHPRDGIWAERAGGYGTRSSAIAALTPRGFELLHSRKADTAPAGDGARPAVTLAIRVASVAS